MTPRLKCYGDGCPIAKKCWRYVAPAAPYDQDYLDPRFSVETASCPDQWAVRRYDADVIAGRIEGDPRVPMEVAPRTSSSRNTRHD